MTVEKRDGRIVQFDDNKIVKAVTKAATAIKVEFQPEQLEKIKKYVVIKVSKLDEPIKIDDIHDAVEEALMKFNFFEVEKAYHDYRKERDKKRFIKFDVIKMMESKYNCEHNEHQNANIDENSVNGRTGEASSAYQKEFALDYMMSEKFAKNHKSFECYIHDLDKYKIGMHNCFGRNTKFLTKDGIKSFFNFKDGESVEVLCNDGKYHKATVRYYGKKLMNHVILKRGNIEKKILCTPDHRWILKDGQVTTNLSVGDSIALLNEHLTTKDDVLTKRDAEIFTLGFAIGDGCDKNNKYILVRLCNAKMQYKYLFEMAGYHFYSKADNGDESFIKDIGMLKQDFLTSKSWNILSSHEKALLFAGLYAADGGQTTTTKGIATSDERVLQLIKDISYFAGYHVSNIVEKIHTTNYKKDARIFGVSLVTHQSNNTPWKVTKIIKSSQKEYDAWCVEEPDTHSFILSSGIVTGNCLSIPFDDLLNNPVSIKTKYDIRSASSISSAAQLIIVYFQTQSMVQFGGVSATHLDWTFVPFVRKSFRKHFKNALIYIEGMTEEEAEKAIQQMENEKSLASESTK